MKKFLFLLFFLLMTGGVSAREAVAEKTAESEAADVVLDLQPGDESKVREITIGEQIQSVLDIGRFFEENYPGEMINTDMRADVRRFFPGVDEATINSREALIRDGIKVYRYFYDVYQRVKEALLVPDEAPLVLDEEEYEHPGDSGEYIESPDLVVVNDFKKVLSYSSEPRDFQAYVEKNRRDAEKNSAVRKDDSLSRLEDMLSRLELKKLLFYGNDYQDPLTKGGGNGAWVEEDGVRLRLVSAYAAVNDMTEMQAALHFDLPPDKMVKFIGSGRPNINLKSDNLSGWAVFVPEMYRIKAGENKLVGRWGNFAVPVLLKIKDIKKPLNVTAEAEIEVCDLKSCRRMVLKPELSLKPGFGYASTVNNFIVQSFIALPKESADDIQAKVLAAVTGKNGGEELLLRLKTDENPAMLDVFVDNEYGIEFDMPQMRVNGDFVDVTLRPKETKEVLSGREFTLQVTNHSGQTLKTTLTAEKGSLPDVGSRRGAAGIIFAAFVGGMLLNLMPGVLAVWILKIMSLAEYGAKRPAEVRKSFGRTVGGIFVLFAWLTVGLVFMKFRGQELYWGMVFQSGWFLTLVLLAMVWFLFRGYRMTEFRFGETEDKKEEWSLISGVMIALTAVSFTAPYLAEAVGEAFAGSRLMIISAMAAAACGLAVPGLLLWGFPELALAVPRPGRWLEGARKIMCGLMLAAAGWLLWSAAAQISDRALLRLCLYPVLLIVLLLLKKNALLAVANMRNAGDERKDIERFIRWGAALLSLGVILLAAADMNRQFQENPQRQAVSAVDFEKLRKEADDGRVVFVKIDAAWSVASRFNRYTVFNSPMVHNIFDGGKVELIEADMTVYNRKTAEFMKHFGRYSAPLYVIFSPQLPDGLVLPDLLTEKDLVKMLNVYAGNAV